MAEVSVSQLKEKLNEVNSNLVKLESDSIFAVKDEERKQMMDILEAWKLKKEDFKKELYAGLLSKFSVCYEALDILDRFVKWNLDVRFEKLMMTLADPDDTIGGFMNLVNVGDPEAEKEEEFDESLEESEVKRRILEKMIVTCKALLGDIKLELENSERKNLTQWLRETDRATYLPYEWYSLYQFRIKVINTGIELSQLLVQFMISLAGNETKIRRLKLKIESIIIAPRKCKIVETFLTLMEMTGDALSGTKLKSELMLINIDEDELLNMMINQFFAAILNLESMMSSLGVPGERRFVAGARLRLENALGQTLYIMQGLKLNILKQKTETWKTMKAVIADLWNDMESLDDNDDEATGSSGTKQSLDEKNDEAAGSSGTKQSLDEKNDEAVGSSKMKE